MVRRTGSALVRTLWKNVAKPLAGEFPLLTGACMNHKIRKQVVKRKITRLCHFTQSRNLRRILKSRSGLLSTELLRDLEKKYSPTDTKRLDRHTNHVCCSIQYPNCWYLRKATERDDRTGDWVVLLLCPSHLWMDGTKFCDTNAAVECGGRVRTGLKGFKGLFADEVAVPGQSAIYTRASKLACVPTDDQAEVLIPHRVRRDTITGLVVRSADLAERELKRLKKRNLPTLKTLIAPTLFRPNELSQILRSGKSPEEIVYCEGSEDA